MKIKTNGTTRMVLVFDKFVVKIPNFLYSHQNFLHGMYNNWSERLYCKQFKGIEGDEFYSLVCPSFWCSWFGLIQIQARAIIFPDIELDPNYKYKFKDFRDVKSDNLGYYKGRVVIVGYA